MKIIVTTSNWPIIWFLIFIFFRWRNDWHLWYHFCSFYILSWISLPKGDPVLSCLLGKKRRKSLLLSQYEKRCYRGYSPLEDYEICTASAKAVSIGKSKVFGIRTVVVYIVSSFFFSRILTIFFTRVFPFLYCLLSTTDKTKVFFMEPFLQSFPPFLQIFFLFGESNDHVNITTKLMLHICYCALCSSSTVFEKYLKMSHF